MYNSYTTEEEEKKNDKSKINWKFLAVSTAVVGVAYWSGIYRGFDLGRKSGSQEGYLEGYAHAAKDIAYAVKEAVSNSEE